MKKKTPTQTSSHVIRIDKEVQARIFACKRTLERRAGRRVSVNQTVKFLLLEKKIPIMIVRYYADNDGMLNAYLPAGSVHGAVWLCCARNLDLLRQAIARNGLMRGVDAFELVEDEDYNVPPAKAGGTPTDERTPRQ